LFDKFIGKIVQITANSSVMAKPNPYGVRAVRHLKSSTNATSRKRVDRTGRVCQTKQAVMERTYDYFLREVDPIIGECITYLLCIRPDDVAVTMLDFLEKKQKGEKPAVGTAPTGKATKAQRLYLATQISPVITKLVNRIATTRPTEVLPFMCSELASIVNQGDSLNRDKSQADKSISSNKAPSVSGSVEQKSKEPVSVVDTPVENVVPTPEVKKAIPRSMNIIFLGMNGAGKSSFIDALQGKFNDGIRPTIGFRPTSMMMGDDKIRFYDIGGGIKIRKIWPEYYHDTHAIVYMVDSAETDEDKIGESVALFKETMSSSMLQNKPILFLSNKHDIADAKSSEAIKSLYQVDGISNCTFAEVSCHAGSPESSHAGEADPRMEVALEGLLKQVQDQYDTLNTRVEKDSIVKAELEAKKRREKERKILRNKILCAFPDKVNKEFVTEDTPKEPEDVFSVEDGETFLAAEIGVDKLPPIGVDVAAMIGYQKLALQMVGAFICPISKKKKAMSWDECKALVVELRSELGLGDL
jgi:signal recognition particle receptor subunit beta